MATLNNVATQLLLYLLQNGKEISSRDEILQNVFQHNGARATDANLNQHISFLRKAITSTGHPAELIVTIPRIGFRMGDASINIQQLEEAQAPTRIANIALMPEEKETKPVACHDNNVNYRNRRAGDSVVNMDTQ